MESHDSIIFIDELVSDMVEIAKLGRFKRPSEITPLCIETEEVGGALTAITIPGLVLVNGNVVVIRIKE